MDTFNRNRAKLLQTAQECKELLAPLRFAVTLRFVAAGLAFSAKDSMRKNEETHKRRDVDWLR